MDPASRRSIRRVRPALGRGRGGALRVGVLIVAEVELGPDRARTRRAARDLDLLHRVQVLDLPGLVAAADLHLLAAAVPRAPAVLDLHLVVLVVLDGDPRDEDVA